MDSILTSVKKMLGITEEYEHFDADIVMHINTVFMGLYQMGIGPKECFSITDDSYTWDDFLEGDTRLEGVKTYVYQKVRLMFDPPSSSAHMEALNKNISEIEWRLMTMVETATFKEG